MGKKIKSSKNIKEEGVSQILKGKSCPAFYFFTDIGDYTGKLATGLVDLRDKIEDVKTESIEFHFSRGDFQKWIRDCIGDSALADRISKISKKLEGKKLRAEVHRVVDKRIKELQKLLTSEETCFRHL